MKLSNEKIARFYLRKYQEKDLQAIASVFTEDIHLRDWKISVYGKTNALAETQKNFEEASTIDISVMHLYQNENTVAAELEITVNKSEILYVVDVISFDADGKIKAIRAYLGRGN